MFTPLLDSLYLATLQAFGGLTFCIPHRDPQDHSFLQNPILARRHVDELVWVHLVHSELSAAAVVEADLGAEEALLALPVGLEDEVAMPGQHFHGN